MAEENAKREAKVPDNVDEKDEKGTRRKRDRQVVMMHL